MAYTLFLDNSNVFIEGQHVSAVKKGLARNITDAIRRHIQDHTYRLDFGRLIEITCGYGSKDTVDAKLYGSRPPEQDTVWNMAKEQGFSLNIFDKSYFGKEKQVDTTIVMHMTIDIVQQLDPTNDKIVLVAGDADFIPVVKLAVEKGFSIKVAFWSHASGDLKKAASEFQNLNGHLADLKYWRGKK